MSSKNIIVKLKIVYVSIPFPSIPTVRLKYGETSQSPNHQALQLSKNVSATFEPNPKSPKPYISRHEPRTLSEKVFEPLSSRAKPHFSTQIFYPSKMDSRSRQEKWKAFFDDKEGTGGHIIACIKCFQIINIFY